MDYIQLNPFDTEPLYRQLKNAIKKAILTDRLKDKDELPSENLLVSLFDISSTVVKAAYQALENESLVIRIRGKGTFVNYPKQITINLPFYSNLNAQISFNFVNLTATNLEKDAPMWDQFPNAKSIAKVRRLIYMNQILTTYQEIYLPNQNRETMHAYMNRQKNMKDIILESSINPKQGKWVNKHGMKKATDVEAQFMAIPIGSPLHKIASAIYDNDHLIGLVFTFIRGDIVSLRYDKRP
jgi:DNA-binding GntR family transcriptional regulator